MRSLTRSAAATAAGLLSLTALGLTSPAAVATTPVTVVGSAPATAHGPSSVTFSYAITLPSDVTSAVLRTHQAAALPASATGVLLDGVAVPVGRISQPSSVDIAVQAGAQPTDTLVSGVHTISFQASLAAAPSVSTSSTATFTWVDSGGSESLTSAPVSMQVNQPDLTLTLTPDTGEDQVGFLGTGSNLDLLVDVVNAGYGSPRSNLTIDLPAGMTLGAAGVTRDSDGSDLACTDGPGNSVVCDLGQVARGAADPTLDIDLTTMANEPIGSTVPVTVSVAPQAGEGTDANASNDSATVQVLYTGSAHLSYRMTPSSSKVRLGQSTKVTLTVTNHGPQTAPSTVAIAIVVGSQFTVTDFTGTSLSADGGSGSAATPQLAKQAHLLAAPTAQADGVATAPAADDGTGILWYIGDLAPGASTSAVLTLKATAIGKSAIQLLAVSGAGDPGCTQLDCTPAALALSVVAAPIAVPVAVPVAAAGPSEPVGAGLANTGASNRPALVGGSLLLVGLGLMFGGRRRAARR